MKNILISHSDLDGLGSIVLAKYFSVSFSDVISTDYGFEEKDDLKDHLLQMEEIIIADLSVPLETYTSLAAKGITVRIYDHHDTAAFLSREKNCVIDKSRSGTKIFFEEYLKPIVGRYKPIVSEFVDLVDCYDRWVLESPLRKEAENLQRVYSSYASWSCPDNLMKHDRFITNMIRKFEKEQHFNWNSTEKLYIAEALRKEEESYQEAINTMKILTDGRGNRFGIWKAWGRISSTASRILNVDKADLKYLICIQDSPDNYGKLSFRSRDDEFDVTTLAGVGGHRGAGGINATPFEANNLWSGDFVMKYKDEWKEGETVIETLSFSL